MNRKPFLLGCLAFGILIQPWAHGASWFERLGFGRKTTNSPAASLSTALSQDQMVSGLKEALDRGVSHAIATLGREDGFLKDLSARIPIPDSLRLADESLRKLGQDKVADDFIATMNHAAEKAVPEAAAVLAAAVQQMTLTDAKAILLGTNNAATQYFRRTSETNLNKRLRPIVEKATTEVGVTHAYKGMMGKTSFVGSFIGRGADDLDGYITQKALDGLFLKIADEEKRIREDPVARTTDLLQQVFGAIGR